MNNDTWRLSYYIVHVYDVKMFTAWKITFNKINGILLKIKISVFLISANPTKCLIIHIIFYGKVLNCKCQPCFKKFVLIKLSTGVSVFYHLLGFLMYYGIRLWLCLIRVCKWQFLLTLFTECFWNTWHGIIVMLFKITEKLNFYHLGFWLIIIAYSFIRKLTNLLRNNVNS